MLRKLPLFLLIIFACASAKAQQTQITLEPGANPVTINKNIYGHFAEHLGRCIYGGFYVGENNDTIPNTQGLRTDIIDALKKLQIPLLRWPGGCFADTYHWKDGIGPKEERPTIVNTNWGGVTEDNSFGTHDFMRLCELLGAEPYLAGNVGSGEVQELADWVQYVNFSGKSPMSDLRTKNGHKEPWGVRYWGIGNEAWGCGGNMTAEYYANIYRKYATFMSGTGLKRGIFRIASGASDADYHWTEVLMRDIPHNMVQGMALHHYAVIDWSHKGSSIDYDEDQYFTTMQRAWQMEELVTKHSAIMDKYDPDKKIALVVDEWGGWYDVMPDTNPGFLYQQNTMRDAMIAGMTLNIFNNHADRVRMANLAQAVNVLQSVILTQGDKMLLTPTYHVMEMYKVHQDGKRIPLEIKTSDYEHNGDKLPAVNASASVDSTGVMTISLVNIDLHNKQSIRVNLAEKYKNVSGRILNSAHVQDFNSFDKPHTIEPQAFTKAKINKKQLTLEVPPFSVIVLRLEK